MRIRGLAAVGGLVLMTMLLAGCGGAANLPSYSISGKVLRADNGEGLARVSLHIVHAGGLTVPESGADGSWRATGIQGTATITPAGNGFTFTPGSYTVNSARTDLEFTAACSLTYDIWGTIEAASGEPIKDVVVTVGGTSVKTNALGRWYATVQGMASVTPSKPGWDFTPATVQVNGLPDRDLNFTGTPPGTPKSGALTENTTWTLAGSPYALTGDVEVPTGIVLLIEPGVTVNGGFHRIKVEGGLTAVGQYNHRIALNDADVILGANSTWSNPSYLTIQYADLTGNFLPNVTFGYAPNLVLRDCTLKGATRPDPLYLAHPTQSVYIERNVFQESAGIQVALRGTNAYIRNNVFYQQLGDYAVRVGGDTAGSQVVIERNSFLSEDRVAVRLEPTLTLTNVSLTNNYWNGAGTAGIDAMIYDRKDDLACAGELVYEPYLLIPHADTPLFTP